MRHAAPLTALSALVLCSGLALGCDSSSSFDTPDPPLEDAEGALVRVSVVTRLGDGVAADAPFDLDGVEICQGSTCRSAALETRASRTDSENSSGLMVGEVRLDDAPVTSIRLLGASSPRSGALRWADRPIVPTEPLVLAAADRPDGAPYFPNHHLYVVLADPDAEGVAQASFGAVSAMPAAYGGSMLYDPVLGASVDLDDGFGLSFGPGAQMRGQPLGEPMVVAYQTVETGEIGPQVTVSPGAMESGVAQLRLPLRMDRLPEGATMADVEVRADGAVVPTRLDGTTLVAELSSFADVRVGIGRPTIEDAEGRRLVVPGSSASRAGGSCSSYLSTNRDYFENYLDTESYIFYTRGCVDRNPNLHIIMAGTRPSRLPGLAPGIRHQMTPSSSAYSLFKIDEHVANFNTRTGLTMVGAINGFTWAPVTSSDADAGKGAGGRGTLQGTVDWDGTRRSTTTGAEAIMAFTRRSGSYVYGRMDRRFSGPSPDLGTYDYTSVGSTTSLVVNGACSNSGASNRWSAIGYGNGIVMLVSSGDGDARAEELCEVFTAMGITSAIRLDGASAATMAFNGAVKNPNTGFSSYYWGPVRRVAYAVGVTNG